MDGEEVTDIIVIGRVAEVFKESMRTLVDISDTTEMANVIFYQKGEMEEPECLKGVNLTVGNYVKIYGSMRVFKEKRAIVASKCEEIIKHDEITNHLLQSFVAHNIRIKGTLSSDQIKTEVGQGKSNQGFNQPKGGEHLGVDHSNTVLDLMKEVTKNNRFCHKKDLWSICQKQMSVQQFDRALDTLMDDGAIYTAVDDNQYGIIE